MVTDKDGQPASARVVGIMSIQNKFGSLGQAKNHFASPHGFCLGLDDDIVIADTNNHRICVYGKGGDYKYHFGESGKDEGKLWFPRKIVMINTPPPANSVDKGPRYVICDRGTERSRMQIFSFRGDFIRKIGIRYIDIVAGLAVTPRGEIVAVDSVSPTIFVIHETGDLLRWIDASPSMREPSDVAVKGDEFYVCDFKGSCVAVFNSEDGQCVRKIGCKGVTDFPNGIDISPQGEIFVGDSHGNRFHVVVFDSYGHQLGEFECPYVKVSRCCGLKLTREGYVVTLAKNNHHALVLDLVSTPKPTSNQSHPLTQQLSQQSSTQPQQPQQLQQHSNGNGHGFDLISLRNELPPPSSIKNNSTRAPSSLSIEEYDPISETSSTPLSHRLTSPRLCVSPLLNYDLSKTTSNQPHQFTQQSQPQPQQKQQQTQQLQKQSSNGNGHGFDLISCLLDSSPSLPVPALGHPDLVPDGNGHQVSSRVVELMSIHIKFGALGQGKNCFASPHGFCLGLDDDIVIADTNNHRICVYSKDGDYKYHFGIGGKDEGQLWFPRKIAMINTPAPGNSVEKGPRYVVCDRGTERSRMQIFSYHGNFLKKISIRYIDIVAGLAITPRGEIVAVDSVSPTIFVIHESGDLLRWIDASPSMREPSDVAVKGDEFYVCDFKGSCVAVFNSENGQCVRKIGCKGVTDFPNGIDISPRGEIFVGDSHGNRFHVVVFDSYGHQLGEFECPYVKVSRCCGLKLTRGGHVVTLAKNNHHALVLDLSNKTPKTNSNLPHQISQKQQPQHSNGDGFDLISFRNDPPQPPSVQQNPTQVPSSLSIEEYDPTSETSSTPVPHRIASPRLCVSPLLNYDLSNNSILIASSGSESH
ncbi:uncharacterized protein LOC141850993 [Brevipalpus obovatus]|uniref:uncharacterized protein LOC141850993 n=1 Tax=Brevipalpus obovatus TaxID=246614 RepID=UPI003D9F1579